METVAGSSRKTVTAENGIQEACQNEDPMNANTVVSPSPSKNDAQDPSTKKIEYNQSVKEPSQEEAQDAEHRKKAGVPSLPLAPPSKFTGEKNSADTPQSLPVEPTPHPSASSSSPSHDKQQGNSDEVARAPSPEYCGPIAKPRAPKSSHYRGVSKTVRGKWQARLCVNSTQRNLGCSFKSPEEAARVWDAAAILHFGDVVSPQMLNFPDEYRPNSIQYYQNFLVSAGALLCGPPPAPLSMRMEAMKKPENSEGREPGQLEKNDDSSVPSIQPSEKSGSLDEGHLGNPAEGGSRMKYTTYHDTRRHHGHHPSTQVNSVRAEPAAEYRMLVPAAAGATLIPTVQPVPPLPVNFAVLPVPVLQHQAPIHVAPVGPIGPRIPVAVPTGSEALSAARAQQAIPVHPASAGRIWPGPTVVGAAQPASVHAGTEVQNEPSRLAPSSRSHSDTSRAEPEPSLTVNRFAQKVAISEVNFIDDQLESSEGRNEDCEFNESFDSTEQIPAEDPGDQREEDMDLETAESGTLHWNEFQRAFRGKGVPMATLQLMYRSYKRGEFNPEFDKFRDVDLRKAEEEAAQDRLALAQDLYHFLTEGQEDEDGMERLPSHFFRGQACFATNWNDFQKLFRGKGHTMNELQDMYRRYKRQLNREDSSPVNQLSINGKDSDAQEKGRGKASGKKRKQREVDDLMYTSDYEFEASQERLDGPFAFFGDGDDPDEEQLLHQMSDAYGGKSVAISKSDLHIWNAFQSHYKGSGLSVAELQHRYREFKAQHSQDAKTPNRPGVPMLETSLSGMRASTQPSEPLEEAADSSCSVCLGGTHTDLWVMCDECEEWQHQLCAGYLSETEVPETHFCDNCMATRAAKGLPLPKPIGRDDSIPVQSQEGPEGEELCADAELKFSSKSLLYATREPQHVDRKRIMADKMSGSVGRQIPLHLLAKQGSDEILLGTLDVEPGLIMGDVRMQVRELLVLLQVAQPQTCFCMYKVTSSSFRDGAKTEPIKIAIWPTQDHSLAETVFRNPTDRLLIALGRVLPVASLEAKILQELTLQTIKPLVVANNQQGSKPFDALFSLSAAFSGGIEAPLPPSGCPVPKPLRPKQSVVVAVPVEAPEVVDSDDSAHESDGATGEPEPPRASAVEDEERDPAQAEASPEASQEAEQLRGQKRSSRDMFGSDSSPDEVTNIAHEPDASKDVHENEPPARAFMPFKRPRTSQSAGSLGGSSDHVVAGDSSSAANKDAANGPGGAAATLDGFLERDASTPANNDGAANQQPGASQDSDGIRSNKEVTSVPALPAGIQAPRRAFTVMYPVSCGPEGDGVLQAVLAGPCSSTRNPNEAIAHSRLADLPQAAATQPADKLWASPQAPEATTPPSTSADDGTHVPEPTAEAAPGGEPAEVESAGASAEGQKGGAEETTADAAAAEAARQLEQDKQLAAALAEGSRRGGAVQAASTLPASRGARGGGHGGGWTHVVECAACHSLCGMGAGNLGEVCECPICGFRFYTRAHRPAPPPPQARTSSTALPRGPVGSGSGGGVIGRPKAVGALGSGGFVRSGSDSASGLDAPAAAQAVSC